MIKQAGQSIRPQPTGLPTVANPNANPASRFAGNFAGGRGFPRYESGPKHRV